MTKTYDLGEFASFLLEEDQDTERFRITVEGDRRYADLIAHKIGQLRITEDELRKWSEDD